MQKFVQFIENNLKQQPIIKMVIIIFAIIGAISTGFTLFEQIKSLNKPNIEKEVLKVIDTDINYDNIVSIAGYSQIKEDVEVSMENYSIHHYEFKSTYVSFFLNESNTVKAFTVVNKSKKKVSLPKFFQDVDQKYMTSKTSIYDLVRTPNISRSTLSTRDTHFSEIFGTGSYGGYKWYLFGYSQLGKKYDVTPIADYFFSIEKKTSQVYSTIVDKENPYRKKIIPNSYGVISDGVTEDFLIYIAERFIGPPKYLVGMYQ